MANRHANKKLRASIQARMEATGESYQKARSRVLEGVAKRSTGARVVAELIEVPVQGGSATLALTGWVLGPAGMAGVWTLLGPSHDGSWARAWGPSRSWFWAKGRGS